jgi:hypothetical protein
MKTIFNKIDPQYLECASGTCEHASHKGNTILWILLFSTVLYIGLKTFKRI